MMKSVLSVGVLIILAAMGASADQVTWTLTNANFGDGGVATGFFVFNADQSPQFLEPLTDWNIDTSGGDTTTFFPFDFTPANSAASLNTIRGEITFRSNDTFPTPAGPAENLFLGFVPLSPLTDAGGTIGFDLSSSFATGECFNCDPQRKFVSGAVTSTPEPGDLTLLSSALLGIALLRRRRPR